MLIDLTDNERKQLVLGEGILALEKMIVSDLFTQDIIRDCEYLREKAQEAYDEVVNQVDQRALSAKLAPNNKFQINASPKTSA